MPHDWIIEDHGTRIGTNWRCRRCRISGGGTWQDLGRKRVPAPYVPVAEFHLYTVEQLEDCELMSVRSLMRE